MRVVKYETDVAATWGEMFIRHAVIPFVLGVVGLFLFGLPTIVAACIAPGAAPAAVTARPHPRDMRTLHDTIDLAVEVGAPVEAGPLRLFPLFVTGPSAPDYLPGPDAGSAGAISVDEHGDGAAVAELVLTSAAAIPLLLLEGETVLGVKQNRTLNVSVLCQPHTPTVIPVSCVEAGRWGAVQPVSHSPRLSPSTLRAAKTRSVVDSVRTRALKCSDQGLVWDTVAAYADRIDHHSPTAALEDVATAAAPDVAAIVEGLRPVGGQRGVLVVSGSGMVALDLFDKEATLAAYWDGLLAGHALDAVGGRAVAAGGGAGTDPAAFDRSAAAAFLERVLGSPATESPAVALGKEIHFGDDDVTGGALVWEDAIVHLAAFGAAGGTSGA